MSFEVGDKVIPSDVKKWNDNSQYKIIDRVENESGRNAYYLKGKYGAWYDEGLELFEEVEEVEKLTFKEVMERIQEGEEWECTRENAKISKIIKTENIISFELGDRVEVEKVGIRDSDLFEKAIKYMNFQEAYERYREGEVIKSLATYVHYQKDTKEIFVDGREIEGKWIVL